jgi:plasmid maintenance system antidote protein VapI
MAIRLEKGFGGTAAHTRLRKQMNYDLVRARKTENRIKVMRYKPARAAA